MKNIKIILLILYFLISLVSWYFSYLSYKSLSFHPRDYSYYLEFATKITDPNLKNRYSVSPIGNNMFFQRGPEGSDSFYQSIHFEPVKYFFYPALYIILHSPLLIFGFLAFLYFLPIAYIAIHIDSQNKQDKFFLFLLSVLYAIFPISLLVPGFDLRPYILLGPIFLTGILASFFEKSYYEKFFWLNALFFIREEALILGLIHLILAFITSTNKKFLAILTFCWLFWAGSIAIYFVWTGYESIFQQKLMELFFYVYLYIKNLMPFRLFLFLSAIVGLFLAWMLLKTWRKTSPTYREKYFTPIGYFLIFIPVTYQLIVDEPEILSLSLDHLAKILLFTPRYAIYFLLLLGFFILIFRILPSRIKFFTSITTFILILALIPINLFHPLAQGSYFQYYQDRLIPAADIFVFKETINPYTNKILTDGGTHQAFYDFNNIYMYSRLPLYIEPERNNRYPENIRILERLIIEDIDFVVISSKSEAVLVPLLVDTAVQTEIVFNNGQYLAIKIIRE